MMTEKNLGDAIEGVVMSARKMTESWCRKRHGQLVDRKFAAGLTESEAHELERINRFLDGAEAPHYRSVKRHLYDTLIGSGENVGKVQQALENIRKRIGPL